MRQNRDRRIVMALGAERYNIPRNGGSKDCSIERKKVKKERQLLRNIPKMYNRGLPLKALLQKGGNLRLCFYIASNAL